MAMGDLSVESVSAIPSRFVMSANVSLFFFTGLATSVRKYGGKKSEVDSRSQHSFPPEI